MTGYSASALIAISAGLLFGASDLIATRYARRHGTVFVAIGVTTVSTAALILIALREMTDELSPSVLAAAGVLGLIGGAGYVLMLEAYRRGPIASVAPIAASTGTLALLLALAVYGGSLDLLNWLGVALVAIGALAAATRSGPQTSPAGKAPVFALAGVACVAIAVVGLQQPITEIGWLPAVAAWRVGHVVIVLGLAAAFGSTQRSAPAWTGWMAVTLAMIAFAGLLDASGQVTRALGLLHGPTWLVVLLAASGPLLVTVGAKVVFREPVQRTQAAGLGAVIAGSTMLAAA